VERREKISFGCQVDSMGSMKQSVAVTQYSGELVGDLTLDQTMPSPVTSKREGLKTGEVRNREQQEMRDQELRDKEQEVCGLRQKLNSQTQEMLLLKKELQRCLLASENLAQALFKAKKAKPKLPQINLDTHLSDIQSYSILEKIEQWKEE
jgi:hypothetical protein